MNYVDSLRNKNRTQVKPSCIMQRSLEGLCVHACILRYILKSRIAIMRPQTVSLFQTRLDEGTTVTVCIHSKLIPCSVRDLKKRSKIYCSNYCVCLAT
jgi:hypothetical protein